MTITRLRGAESFRARLILATISGRPIRIRRHSRGRPRRAGPARTRGFFTAPSRESLARGLCRDQRNGNDAAIQAWGVGWRVCGARVSNDSRRRLLPRGSASFGALWPKTSQGDVKGCHLRRARRLCRRMEDGGASLSKAMPGDRGPGCVSGGCQLCRGRRRRRRGGPRRRHRRRGRFGFTARPPRSAPAGEAGRWSSTFPACAACLR